MFAIAGHLMVAASEFHSAKKAPKMSSQTGNWMIAVGALGGFIGIRMLPAAMGEHPDTSLLVLGACGVSLGSMITASGVYLKARALQSPAGQAWRRQNLRTRSAGCAAVAMSVTVTCP